MTRGELTDEDVQRHAEILANRVKKNLKKLQPQFERENVGVFRLYDWDIPEVRAAVDWYEGQIVVAEYARDQTDKFPDWIGRMGRAVADRLGIAPGRVHLKSRRTRTKAKGKRYDKLGRTNKRIEVRERELKFLVNLEDYVDTGLFADHRDTRKRIQEEASGKAFLNLFGYTGSFTCYAALGGAKHTTTVDLSGPYLGWAKDNLELNGLLARKHDLVKADVLDWLEEAKSKPRRYDLAVVDPPSFSTRGGQGHRFDVKRDHPALLQATMAVMRKKGVIYFSTNHQRFDPRFERLKAKEIVEITAETIPPDFRNRKVHRVFRISV